MKPFFSKAALLATGLTLAALTGCDKTAEQPDVAPKAAAQSAAATAAFKAGLALRWAPVHYQDTDVTGDHGLSGKGDYLTAINFDGDWVGTNNWNNLASRTAAAHGYYSVVETSTHWFITYAFFHPRDWTDNVLLYNIDEHENDLEGLLAVVKKDGSTYGNLQGIVTVAHSDFYSFVPAGSPLQANQEDLDGSLTMEQFNGGLHPVTAQEAKGHGLKAFPYYKLNGDGIKYFPSATVAEAPASADDRDVRYKLVDIFEPNGLWEQRFNTALFTSPDGGFVKSKGNGGANAPWAWDDGNDVPGRGELATDPAKLVNSYFKNLGSFDLNYIDNPYKGIIAR
ncbi:hypothetical protein [Hymenobacter chitinivorans]|uniref:Uncharacterized protein n=1 Tax=Hymenobacter chitinivorans DSM 11115 TaxID=1121954 RepID=A0A2M9BSQ4_9BACT|nr:hypothetical protein [Hymenobacter chitinivorans]PJJ60989.1 hypothetical protein CLV45_2426 [Hymenobacter chitinivorans DSM 11115]